MQKKALIGGFLLILGSLHRTEGKLPILLTNLTMAEFVHVINDETKLQLNLELQNYGFGERLTLDRSRLAEFTAEDLVSALRPSTNYTVVTNGAVYTLVPKHRIADHAYEMSYAVDDFGVTNAHPFVAGSDAGTDASFRVRLRRTIFLFKRVGTTFSGRAGMASLAEQFVATCDSGHEDCLRSRLDMCVFQHTAQSVLDR